MSNIKTRFAPSPTGKLHVGNARAALLNYLYAMKSGGEFVLRIDDTDPERSKKEFENSIKYDLKWLGLNYNKEFHQSERFSKYNDAVEILKRKGLLYECFETPEELSLKRKVLLTSGKPPIYDREGLGLSEIEKNELRAKGRKGHWRLKLTPGIIRWNDMIRGEVSFDAEKLSDPILIREDGSYIYMICSVVDDADMGITHILRGEDHITNTAIQIKLMEALDIDYSSFSFGHFSLITGESGEALGKRLGSLTLEQLRDDGIFPMAINSMLAKLGSSMDVEVASDMSELVEQFDIGSFSRAQPKFLLSELEHLNTKLLRGLSYEKAKSLNIVPDEFDEEVWNYLAPNFDSISDIDHWKKVLYSDITHMIDCDDIAFMEEALRTIKDFKDNWGDNTWHEWTELLKEKTHRKGKKLYMPLRLAITDRKRGPEMKTLLPMLGYDIVEKRLASLLR